MHCPTCGYAMAATDLDCPRCIKFGLTEATKPSLTHPEVPAESVEAVEICEPTLITHTESEIAEDKLREDQQTPTSEDVFDKTDRMIAAGGTSNGSSSKLNDFQDGSIHATFSPSNDPSPQQPPKPNRSAGDTVIFYLTAGAIFTHKQLFSLVFTFYCIVLLCYLWDGVVKIVRLIRTWGGRH